MMVFGSILLLIMASAIECQIVFPTSRPLVTTPAPIQHCIASNGQAGTCYAFQSTELILCPFFPSFDTTNVNVVQHLQRNFCSHSGGVFFYCCPNNAAVPTPSPIQTPSPNQTPAPLPTRLQNGMKECPEPCASGRCLRPDVIPCEDECGNTNSNNVVGGEVSARNQWPWLAALGRFVGSRFEPFCGGTLITKQHVITAAHCFNIPNIRVIVRLGEYDLNEENDGALDFTIADKRIGDYNTATNENDIIMLKLDRPLNRFTENIKPACLPYHLRNENFEGASPVVAGWGRFENGANARTSPVPLHATVPVVPVPECQQKYRQNTLNEINNNQICAGRGVQDSCKGDSGGPLNYIDTQRFRFYLIGVVSFGPNNCGSQNLPGVYTRISNYLDWINQNIQQLL